jgi:hypothetical protein
MGIIGGSYSLSLSMLAQPGSAWRSTDGCARVFWFNGLRVALYTAREAKTESQQPVIEFGIKLCFSVGVCCALDSDPRQGRLVQLFSIHMDWMGLEKIENNFDLFEIKTHPISLNPHGLRANRTSPERVICQARSTQERHGDTM